MRPLSACHGHCALPATHLPQRLAAAVVLRLPSFEEAALAVLIHVLLLLGRIELLRGDLLGPALVGNDALLHLLRGAALPRQEGIWERRV